MTFHVPEELIAQSFRAISDVKLGDAPSCLPLHRFPTPATSSTPPHWTTALSLAGRMLAQSLTRALYADPLYSSSSMLVAGLNHQLKYLISGLYADAAFRTAMAADPEGLRAPDAYDQLVKATEDLHADTHASVLGKPTTDSFHHLETACNLLYNLLQDCENDDALRATIEKGHVEAGSPIEAHKYAHRIITTIHDKRRALETIETAMEKRLRKPVQRKKVKRDDEDDAAASTLAGIKRERPDE